MKRIDQMFAFVVNDENANGDEGVPAFMNDRGEWMPMMGADMARIEYLRPAAQELASATGKTLTLCVFETRTELEVIEP